MGSMGDTVTIQTIYREVGTGMCRTHYVLGSDGLEYAAKGPSFIRNFRHVATNELVAVGIASKMGLPVQEWRVLTRGKKMFFGSRWIPESLYHSTIDDYLFESCKNKDLVYELVVFDFWICNTDRHSGNLWALCAGDSPRAKNCRAEHALLLIDHAGGLLQDDRDPTHFASALVHTRIDQCVQLPCIQKAIINPARLSKAIDVAESVSDDDIASIVNAVPSKLLPIAERGSWAAFLVSRRNELRKLFNTETDRAFFIWMKAGPI